MADQFDLSLVMRADGSQAVAAGDEFAGSLDKVAAANKRAGASGREAAAGTSAGATASKEAAKATEQHSAALDRLEGDLREAGAAAGAAASSNVTLAAAEARCASAAASLAVAHDKVAAAADKDTAAQNRAAASLTSAQARVAASAAALERSQKGSTRASNDNAAALNRQAFGARSLGQQVGDFATQISLGGSVVQAFSAQVGQAGFAASEMGGKIGAVGKFLVGPWGIALTVAALVISPFIEKLGAAAFGGDKLTDSLDKAGFATSAFKDAQSTLGSVLDLNTGKINTQSSALLGLARAQAIAGQIQSRARAAEARSELAKGRNDFGGTLAQGLAGGGRSARSFVEAQAGRGSQTLRSDTAKISNAVLNGQIGTDSAIKRLDTLLAKGKITEKQFLSLGTTITNLGVEDENLKVYKDLEKALDGDTKSIKGFLNAAKVKKPKKAPKPKSTTAIDEFGRDAQDTINGVLAQFDGTPSLVREVNNQVAKLDDLIEDLGRKKPPNFKELIADAERAKGAVREGLNKPYADYIADQQRSLANTRLLIAGKEDEAAATQVIFGLEQRMGPLTPARKEAVLATVQALRAEERQLDILREKQEKYLTALGEIKSAVKGVITDGLGGIADLPKRLIGAFTQLRSEEIFEGLFGDVFRELEDQVKGTSIVEDASARMADAIGDTINPLADLAAAASKTASALGGAGTGPSVVPAGSGLAGAASVALNSSVGGLSAGALGALFEKASGGNVGAANDNASGDEIVVNGRRRPSALKLFSGTFEKLAKGVGISDEAAKKIGKISGGVISGAATGAFASKFIKPLTSALGVKTSTTGAAIGGGLAGGVAQLFGRTLTPLGGAIAGILGSVIGGLFKKTKSGSATIGNVDGAGGITGTGGNSSNYKKAASGLADSVLGSLDSVVSALGGTLGDFSVSIGQRKKKFVVDTAGTGKTKGSGTTKYDTAEEAQAAALANAIADGAVAGISEAMQRALKSTTDVDKAVAEALKVQTVEELIGGIGTALERTFRDFDKQASSYVATARKYGLDVLAVEKATAEARTALIETTLNDQVGSLKDFLDNLRYGDLAEGSPVDQRNTLLGKIATVQADAEAGKEGASDQLAQLFQKLLTDDRDTFGTAGTEYSGDRALAESSVQRVIDMATKRVNDAATSGAGTVAAINQGNTLADENNALTAQMLVAVNALPSGIAALISGRSAGAAANLNATARAAVA